MLSQERKIMKVYYETEDGVPMEMEYDVLFTFDGTLTGKSYVVFTDHSTDSTGNMSVFAACYNPVDSDLSNVPLSSLSSVKTAEEWDMIGDILEDTLMRINNGDLN